MLDDFIDGITYEIDAKEEVKEEEKLEEEKKEEPKGKRFTDTYGEEFRKAFGIKE